jgi:hypothetical protein
VVKKFVVLRNNLIAHINVKNIAKDLKLHEQFPLSADEVEMLISRAVEILNRYSGLFKRTWWSTEAVGHSDFMDILKRVRRDLERREA